MRAVIAPVDHNALRVPVLGGELGLGGHVVCAETASGAPGARDAPVLRSSGMTSTSVNGPPPAGVRLVLAARPLLGFPVFETISRRPAPGRLRRCRRGRARELGPHPRAARGHALEPPAFAEPLDEVESEAAAQIRARGAITPPRPGSSTSRRTIVPMSPTRTRRCAVGRAAVAHTVGHQLRHDQQRVLQHQRRNPTTQTPHDETRRAGRPPIERQETPRARHPRAPRHRRPGAQSVGRRTATRRSAL